MLCATVFQLYCDGNRRDDDEDVYGRVFHSDGDSVEETGICISSCYQPNYKQQQKQNTTTTTTVFFHGTRT